MQDPLCLIPFHEIEAGRDIKVYRAAQEMDLHLVPIQPAPEMRRDDL